MDHWLRITSPYFVAACIFRRDVRGRWIVVESAPILRRRLMGRDAGAVRAILDREGWRWEWLGNKR
jgi:hypothetical protein